MWNPEKEYQEWRHFNEVFQSISLGIGRSWKFLEILGTYGTYPVMGRVSIFSRFIHEHRRDFDPDFH